MLVFLILEIKYCLTEIFSMVCVTLQAVYTTTEKVFQTIVFLILMPRADTKKLPYVTKDETT